MASSKLDELRKAGVPKFENFLIRIDGMPKGGKTRLAYSVSAQHPHPSKLDPKKPVEVTDTASLQFEANSTLSLVEAGIQPTKVLDWSDPTISLEDMTALRRALPEIGAELREQGVKNLVVDTLSTLNRYLLTKIIEEASHGSDMERIRAYGDVDAWHYRFFEALQATKLNIIGIVHLQHFSPFGEEGGNSDFKKAAAKQVDKVAANQVGGLRTDFIPDMRPKPVGHWGRLSDAILVAKPELVTVRAGVQETRYQFLTSTSADFSAGSRWKLPPVIADNYLYPVIQNIYKGNT